MNSDVKFIEKICDEEFKTQIESIKQESIAGIQPNSNSFSDIEHPLDDDVIKELQSILAAIKSDNSNPYKIFSKKDCIISLWKTLIDKSIKCLRFFDRREPFIDNSNKKPIAWGVQHLYDYFDDYTKFENLLYGGARFYRDHIIHVFRVWFLGIYCLLKPSDGSIYLKKISIGTDSDGNEINVTCLEKISIWTLIALTHDLGYPLEKSQKIIERTKNMMCSFVSNPILSLDLSFSGAQNTINDVVLRFMSSKMHKIKTQCNYSTNLESKSDTNKLEYVAKLQFKYYKKLLNSLEKGDHGIISALLVDKLLLYFEESDFNINEHYVFGEEDVRQFYIRREILRSIASHTCKDIYQLNMMNFAFFLIVIDDSQEWGRKRISELYVNSKINYEFEDVVFDITDTPSDITNACSISEKFTLPKDYENELSGFFERLKSQYDDYCLIFRDGQDTSNRNFDFVKVCKIELEDDYQTVFKVKLDFPNKSCSKYTIELSCANSANFKNAKKAYNVEYFKSKFEKAKNITAITNDSKEYILEVSF